MADPRCPLGRNGLSMCGFKPFGMHPTRPGRPAPSAQAAYVLSGVTRDNVGNPLGGCAVDLFYATGNKQRYSQTVSDASGFYSFTSGDNTSTFFAVFYKAGGTDVAGTTKNNLTFA